jgi:hypothetical protein
MNGYVLPRKISGGLSGTADMTGGNDAPNVKIIPPPVYLTGIVIGFLATIWMPTKVALPIRSRGQLEEFSFVAVLF